MKNKMDKRKGPVFGNPKFPGQRGVRSGINTVWKVASEGKSPQKKERFMLSGKSKGKRRMGGSGGSVVHAAVRSTPLTGEQGVSDTIHRGVLGKPGG